MDVLRLKDDTFELPSNGIGYDLDALPLLKGNSVCVRPFVVGDQRALIGVMGGGDTHRVYCKLLELLMTDPNPSKVDLDEMLISDVLTVLYASHIRSYGGDFDYEFRCEECGKKQQGVCLLTEVPVRTHDDFENFDPNNMDVSVCGHRIEMHEPRLRDEREINKFMGHLKKANRVVNTEADRMYVRMAQLIDSIDGEELSLTKRFEFLQKASPVVLEVMGEVLGEASTGIQFNEITTTCNNCGESNDVPLSIDLSFFRPPASAKLANR